MPIRTRPTGVAVVHNGIIENFRELRERADRRRRASSTSETDTEVVAHLVTRELERGMTPLGGSARRRCKRLRGAFALAFMFAGEDDLLIGARKGSPLAIGYGERRDVSRLRRHRARALHRSRHLSRGRRLGVLTRDGVHDVRCARATRSSATIVKSSASAMLVDKGNHRHFMAKEIHEQPEVVGHTLAHYIDMVARADRAAGDAAVRLGAS